MLEILASWNTPRTDDYMVAVGLGPLGLHAFDCASTAIVKSGVIEETPSSITIALVGDSQAAKDEINQLVELPAGVPRPHATRNWGKYIEKELIANNLTDVAHGKFPPGMFPKKWSKKALEPVEVPPDDAPYKDRQAYKRECVELEKRVAYNAQLTDQKSTYWRNALNMYFDILTRTMERTQPGLREILREKYHSGDGYYDGVAAMKYITAWLKNALLVNPQHDHYEQGHST